jgi:hypothetical protein
MGENTDDGLCGCRPTFLVLYFTFSPPTRTSLLSGIIARTGGRLLQQHPRVLSSLQAWVDRPSLLEWAVVVGTHFEHHLGHSPKVYGFIGVVKESTPHGIAVEKIEGPYHLVPEIQAATGNGSVWIVNDQVDLDRYRDVY